MHPLEFSLKESRFPFPHFRDLKTDMMLIEHLCQSGTLAAAMQLNPVPHVFRPASIVFRVLIGVIGIAEQIAPWT
jgi:hypothetical protein